MKYRKVALETTTEAVDFVSCLFDELGMEGIQIEDKVPLSEKEKKAMFIDILPDLGEDDGVAVVSSYIPMDWDMEDLRLRVDEGLKQWEPFVDLGSCRLTFSETDDKDWLNNWKEFFKPFRASSHIVIKPTWETYEKEKEEDILVEIDPGTAFGTGSHETTHLCIEMLDKYIKKGDAVLDVGCGSGILSIIALKLQAGKVRATEIDPNAAGVTLENMEENHLSSENVDFQVYTGNLLSEEKTMEEVGKNKYDIVVANILADVIVPLSAEVPKYMKEDGLFISSGIINTKEEEVRQALLENGFEIVELQEENDWRCFVAKHKG